jgi:hypothetical protein
MAIGQIQLAATCGFSGPVFPMAITYPHIHTYIHTYIHMIGRKDGLCGWPFLKYVRRKGGVFLFDMNPNLANSSCQRWPAIHGYITKIQKRGVGWGGAGGKGSGFKF